MNAPPQTDIGALAARTDELRAWLSETRTGIDGINWYLYDILGNLGALAALVGDRDLGSLTQGLPVADIGAADGDLAFVLERELGWQLDIIDNAPTNMNGLEGARALRDRLGSKVGIHNVDLDTQFSLPRQRYGLVLLLGILYHLQNPYYVLAELAKRTEYLAISTRVARVAGPNHTPIADLPVAYLVGPTETNDDPTNYWMFSSAGLKQIVTRAGWEIISSFSGGDTVRSDPSSMDHDERQFMLLKSLVPAPATSTFGTPAPPVAASLARGAGWLRLPHRDGVDVAVKPAPYLPVYEEIFDELRNQPITILELGIWKGDSLQMWRDCLPEATIVGVDLILPDEPLQLGPRVHVVQGGQDDAELLDRVRAEVAPEGFHVIIDDGSHLGLPSARSLQALYRQHLRPGGTYVIEDWGAGYMPNWPDGEAVDEPLSIASLDHVIEPHRFPSHDSGLVGVVKRLVDHSAAATINYVQPGSVIDSLPIESIWIQNGLAILRKPL